MRGVKFKKKEYIGKYKDEHDYYDPIDKVEELEDRYVITLQNGWKYVEYKSEVIGKPKYYEVKDFRDFI